MGVSHLPFPAEGTTCRTNSQFLWYFTFSYVPRQECLHKNGDGNPIKFGWVEKIDHPTTEVWSSCDTTPQWYLTFLQTTRSDMGTIPRPPLGQSTSTCKRNCFGENGTFCPRGFPLAEFRLLFRAVFNVKILKSRRLYILKSVCEYLSIGNM